MNQIELKEILEKHKKWLNDEEGGERADLSSANLEGAYLEGADLGYANLEGADLRGANLSGADLDFSCLPLWCGSLSAHFDDRQIIQIVYHAVKAGLNSPNVSNDVKTELSKLSDLSNKFHRVEECGMIEPKQERY
jgi:uncharacterized protein YjbI with pentapeptide repeats